MNLKKITNTSFFLLGVALPISIFLSNYLFFVSLVFLLFNSPKRPKVKWMALFMLMIPALIPLLSIYFHNEAFIFNKVDVKIPFLITALIIAFLELNDDFLSKFRYGFLAGSLIAFFLAICIEIPFFLFLKTTLFIELSYTSFFIVIALIYLWFSNINLQKTIKLILSVVFIFALVFLQKTFFITAGFLTIFAAIIIKGSPLQSKIGISFLVLIFSIFLYKGNEIQKHVQNSHQNELAGVNHLSQWQCVLKIMQNNELFGVGYNSKKNLLISCYRDKAMYKAASNSLNSHNEYLNAFLTLGYIGVLGMFVYFLNIMFFTYKTKQVAQLLIIILITSFSILENVFTRQKGVMITSITCLLIFSSKPTKKDKTKQNLPNGLACCL